ncbi:hypothetical protein OEZ86_012957 [Tetradesmus obliquus]|nr:hypothetical protein OEZ86_012957 [Tetradesmus obliquus]
MPIVPSSRAGDNVGFLTDSQVDKKRKKGNFKRSHDGHVALLNRFSKQWTDVKCDLQVPGLLLLREASGQVFYLGYGGLKQVDLSDDQVVAAVAADDWENNMTLVQAETAAGGVEALEVTREDFYSLVSLVSSEDWTAARSGTSLGKAPGTAAAAAAGAAAAGKMR